MPFGPTNAPATFQRAMNEIFADLVGKIMFVYIDDITIYSRTFEEHLRHLRIILDRLRQYHLFLKPKKCTIASNQINLLRHIIDEHGVKTDPMKVEAVIKFPRPTNRTEVRAFMGLVNYYRHFIEGCSRIAEPINRLLRKDQAFRWTPESETAFTTLKTKLTQAPILARPDFGLSFVLHTDAILRDLVRS